MNRWLQYPEAHAQPGKAQVDISLHKMLELLDKSVERNFIICDLSQ